MTIDQEFTQMAIRAWTQLDYSPDALAHHASFRVLADLGLDSRNPSGELDEDAEVQREYLQGIIRYLIQTTHAKQKGNLWK